MLSNTEINDPLLEAYQYFQSRPMGTIQAQAKLGLEQSPVDPGLLPGLDGATVLSTQGYQPIESGFAKGNDGALRVAVLTQMPGVLPRMWDWWFGWHGAYSDRYKIWHPVAHRSARWKDGSTAEGYIGRISMIEEYIGTTLEKANIQFVDPSSLGFDAQQTSDKDQVVYICARLGYTHWPLDFGWLIHQVRTVEGGAEMRSRFWMGGPYIRIRGENWVANALSRVLQKWVKLPVSQAHALMNHCAEEMHHLGGILPEIFAIFDKNHGK